MNLLPRTAPKEFNLLSIGQRGVGKTVFLASSYAELHSHSQAESNQQLWFDCQDTQVREKIEQLLSYIVQTGYYPPLTIKITKFNFSLKHNSLWGIQTLCHFSWSDIPGEICNMHNLDFQNMVFSFHGCCVFIDAYALIHNNAYLQTIETVIEQVIAIANLTLMNDLNYVFALILTKCDLLESDPLNLQQLKQGLQPLISHLDAVQANYKTFYSSIPIIYKKSASTLSAKGTDAPLLWLVWELNKAYNPGLMKHLLELFNSGLQTNFRSQQELVDGSLQRLRRPTDKAVKPKKRSGLYLFSITRRNLLLLGLVILTFVGVIGLRLIDDKRVLQGESSNLNPLENIAALERRGDFYQAIALMEKLVYQEPKQLQLSLHLAQLYSFTGQVTKAETAYDQVLSKQKNNIEALVGKAILRNAQGDVKTAAALFATAEKVAPTHLKAQVHAAQKTLQENHIQTQSIGLRKR